MFTLIIGSPNIWLLLTIKAEQQGHIPSLFCSGRVVFHFGLKGLEKSFPWISHLPNLSPLSPRRTMAGCAKEMLATGNSAPRCKSSWCEHTLLLVHCHQVKVVELLSKSTSRNDSQLPCREWEIGKKNNWSYQCCLNLVDEYEYIAYARTMALHVTLPRQHCIYILGILNVSLFEKSVTLVCFHQHLIPLCWGCLCYILMNRLVCNCYSLKSAIY